MISLGQHRVSSIGDFTAMCIPIQQQTMPAKFLKDGNTFSTIGEFTANECAY